jgi:hypothetical protein
MNQIARIMTVFQKVKTFDLLSNRTLRIYRNKKIFLSADAAFNFHKTPLIHFVCIDNIVPLKKVG